MSPNSRKLSFSDMWPTYFYLSVINRYNLKQNKTTVSLENIKEIEIYERQYCI